MKTKLEEFVDLNQTHELTIEDLKSKTEELEREKEGKTALENMLKSNSNNSEL